MVEVALRSCRTWWKIWVRVPHLWENFRILLNMPDSFLDLVLDRSGGRPLAVHFLTLTRDIPGYKGFSPHHLGPLPWLVAILAAHRIKNFTTRITDLLWQRETCYLPMIFQTTPYPDLDSLDILILQHISCFALR